jgi:exodeoxyribonuclease VII large subunit
MKHLQFTVSEFNQIFANIVHHQLQLNKLCISGEITQFNYYNNKSHLYLTLSHEGSHLQCVIYNQHLKAIPVIQKGDKCDMIGQCKFLKNKGQLIFSGVQIQLGGMGHKKSILDNRLAQFKKDGKFDKKTIEHVPRIIERVCIITANQSAAHHDIMSILSKTPHAFESILIPSSVQGLLAPGELRQALSIAESLSPDIICMSRGGGAEHDFDCFNDERLANQIIASKTAIIAGIGHDINTTLTCRCANTHFETPTAMIQWLAHHSTTPIQTINRELINIQHDLMNEAHALQSKITHIAESAKIALTTNFDALCTTIDHLHKQIIALNPISRLNNGFIYCENKQKSPIRTIQQLAKNDTIYMRLANGKAEATINHVSKTTN